MARRTQWKGDPVWGPSRFWDERRVRFALRLTLVVSLVAHWFVAPWNLLPPSSGIELKDNNDPLSIPVDLMGEEPPPPPEPAPTPVEPPPTQDNAEANKEVNARKLADAGPPPIKDAGEHLSDFDAGTGGDGASPLDAGEADGSASSDAGLIALTSDGGPPGANGPRDPEAMFGLTKAVNAGVQNVVLGLNIALIRKHPVGGRIGPIMQAIPQWKDFLKGAPSPVDPIRDTEWILIYGPSLIHTDKDAVLVRYSASDEIVDTTIGAIAKTYDKGGPFDAGVPGTKASLGYADNAQRVFLRPQSKLLVIVPPSHAHEAAVTFKKQTPRGPHKEEAMRLIVRNPTNQISIPRVRFPQSLTEIRLWIRPRNDDGGADLYGEGDCSDEAAAIDVADKMNDLIKSQNSFGVKMLTHGLLNKAVVKPEGKKVTLHIDTSADQLEAILQLIAAAVGANIAPAASASPPTPPR